MTQETANPAASIGWGAPRNGHIWLIGIALALVIWQAVEHIRTILFPYPLEFRETVELYRTYLVSAGRNIYDQWTMPYSLSVYGFVYNYICAPFVALFGARFWVMRAISSICLVLTAGFFVRYCQIRKADWRIAVLMGLFVFQAAFLHQPKAAPNQLGFLLFVASLFFPLTAAFSNKSLIVCVLLGIVGFFTKIYFGIGPFYVAVYMFLFISKRRAVVFAAVGLLAFLLSLAVVNAVFPYYIGSTILLSYQAANWSPRWLVEQAVYFVFVYSPITLAAIVEIYQRGRSRNLVANFNVVGIAISMILLLKFGGNMGSFYEYFYDLIFPFMSFLFIDLFTGSASRSPVPAIYGLAVNVILAFAICLEHNSLTGSDASFEQVHRTLPPSKSAAVLYEPITSLFAMNRGQTPDDAGQLQYLDSAVPSLKRFYIDEIGRAKTRVSAGYYDTVYEDDTTKTGIGPFLSHCYLHKQDVPVVFYHQNMILHVWKRKASCIPHAG